MIHVNVYQIKSFKYLLEKSCPIHIHFKITKIFCFFLKKMRKKLKSIFVFDVISIMPHLQFQLNWNIPLICNLLITFIETHTRTMLQHAKNFLQHAQTLTNIHYTFF